MKYSKLDTFVYTENLLYMILFVMNMNLIMDNNSPTR